MQSILKGVEYVLYIYRYETLYHCLKFAKEKESILIQDFRDFYLDHVVLSNWWHLKTPAPVRCRF
jgi:hypothetical protein